MAVAEVKSSMARRKNAKVKESKAIVSLCFGSLVITTFNDGKLVDQFCLGPDDVAIVHNLAERSLMMIPQNYGPSSLYAQKIAPVAP